MAGCDMGALACERPPGDCLSPRILYKGGALYAQRLMSLLQMHHCYQASAAPACLLRVRHWQTRASMGVTTAAQLLPVHCLCRQPQHSVTCMSAVCLPVDV